VTVNAGEDVEKWKHSSTVGGIESTAGICGLFKRNLHVLLKRTCVL